MYARPHRRAFFRVCERLSNDAAKLAVTQNKQWVLVAKINLRWADVKRKRADMIRRETDLQRKQELRSMYVASK